MFVLIHGAYHGAWCWQDVESRLTEDGHDVIFPDLPGHGRDPGWLSQQTMPNYAACVAARVDNASAPAILVGHSMGGAIALMAAEAMPDKVAGIVFLTAYIPANGESVGDVVKTDPASHIRVERVDVGGISAVTLKTGTLEDAFYNDATPEKLARAADRVQLQSPQPFRHKLELTAGGADGVAKAAIICSQDRAISPGHQMMMAERAGCDPILDIDTGHSPFVTAPDVLIEAIYAASRNFR